MQRPKRQDGPGNEDRAPELADRYRLLFETTPAGVYRATLGGTLLECNDAFVRIFGFADRQEALSSPLSRLYGNPMDRVPLLDQLRREGAIRNLEICLRAAGGEPFWVLLNESLLPSHDNSASELQGVVVDISERKRAEDALRASEARSRSVIENMVSGLVTLDEMGFISSINPAADRIFGYEKGELIGSHSSILVPPWERGDPEKSLRHVFPKYVGVVTEWEGRRKDGQVFPLEVLLTTFDTPEGLRLALHLRDRSAWQDVPRETAPVAVSADELRASLASIRDSLVLLEGGSFGELTTQARQLLGDTERRLRRLMELLSSGR